MPGWCMGGGGGMPGPPPGYPWCGYMGCPWYMGCMPIGYPGWWGYPGCMPMGIPYGPPCMRG